MKLEILSGGEFGTEQGCGAAAWTLECPTKLYVRKGFMTAQGPCEKLKFLGAVELESERLRDCAQRCIDECNGVILFRSGDLTSLEENIKKLVGDSRPYMEVDFLNMCDPRSVTVWLLAEGITKLYVTGRADSTGLDIFFKKSLSFMSHVIKDINGEFVRNELETRKKRPSSKALT